MRSYGFVVPRFGAGIAGGAEALSGEIARKLMERGDKVEILTTCARDNRSWENEFPKGDTVEGGLVIKRFPVDYRDLEKWVPIQLQIHDGLKPAVEPQIDWMANGVNSSELYEYLISNSGKFDAVFFAPYLFGTTFFGALSIPDNAILIPCLHDEPYAYIEIMGTLFRSVRGALFNSAPEKELAERLYGPLKGGVVGMGFDLSITTKLAPYFEEPFPYLIYVGRKETGKNAHVLIDAFVEGKDKGILETSLKLVIVGGGSFEDLGRASALERGDVIDLPHVSEEEKRRLIKHARILVQPSVNESFSIVLMEAWLLGTPVIVHGRCEVTRHHVLASGGGLYFATPDEFPFVANEISSSLELREELGAAGRRYVSEVYNWDAVLRRFDEAIENIEGPNRGYSDGDIGDKGPLLTSRSTFA